MATQTVSPDTLSLVTTVAIRCHNSEGAFTVADLVTGTGKSETTVRAALVQLLATGAIVKGEARGFYAIPPADAPYEPETDRDARDRIAREEELAELEAEDPDAFVNEAYEDVKREERLNQYVEDRRKMDAEIAAETAEQLKNAASAPKRRGAPKRVVSDLDRTAAAVLKAKRQTAGLKRAAVAREAGSTDAILWRVEERAHINDGELEKFQAAIERMVAAKVEA